MWAGSAKSISGSELRLARSRVAAVPDTAPASGSRGVKLSAGASEHDGIKERVASRLERIEARYGRRILRAPACSPSTPSGVP